MASSEEEKGPAALSVLQSVTEKPVEDHAGEKQPDQHLDTDKVEKTNEEKDIEASKISNEETVQSQNLITEGPTEPKQDSHAEEIPAETVKPGPEAAVGAAVSAHVVTDGEEARQEHSETQDERREDGQIAEGDGDGVKAEERKEADAENERAEDEPDKTEIVEEEETQEEEPQHIATEDQSEDSVEGANLNRNADAIDANVMDPTRVDVTATSVPSEQEAVESQLEEKRKDEAPAESEHPEPDASGATESTNETVGEARDSGEDSEQSKHVPAKGPEDESTSQDGASVLESEMDSESKIDHGSPATIKPDVESDSGSSSAADSNSLDLNLSISSFLSKTKEGSSISLQVHHTLLHYERVTIVREIPKFSLLR